MNQPNTMHVLLCCNPGYLQHAGVLLTSIAEQETRYHYNIVIAIGSDDISSFSRAITAALSRYDHMHVQCKSFTPDSRLVLPKNTYLSLDTFTRIWVADFFGPEVDKVLYLDSDMVVVGSLDPLWETDLSENVIAAVDIPGSTRCAALGIPETAGYFNAGVLLFNLSQWRTSHAFERMLARINNASEVFAYADQDILNAVLYEERTRLDYIWNVIVVFYFPYHDLRLSQAEIDRVRRDARIIHFNSPTKPWSYFSRHPRTDDYHRYLRLTPWRDYVPTDRTPMNRLRRAASSLMPAEFKNWLRRLAAALR